jgi:hypothetical protein
LLLAALSRVPWPTIAAPAVLWAVVGCAGIVYVAIVLRRMRRQGVYEPQFEDWLFHIVLPVTAYAVLTLSAVATIVLARESLFGVAAASLLLLFIGASTTPGMQSRTTYSSATGISEAAPLRRIVRIMTAMQRGGIL